MTMNLQLIKLLGLLIGELVTVKAHRVPSEKGNQMRKKRAERRVWRYHHFQALLNLKAVPVDTRLYPGLLKSCLVFSLIFPKPEKTLINEKLTKEDKNYFFTFQVRQEKEGVHFYYEIDIAIDNTLPRLSGARLKGLIFKGCSEVYGTAEWTAAQRPDMTGYSLVRH